jgi:hypothetical protein
MMRMTDKTIAPAAISARCVVNILVSPNPRAGSTQIVPPVELASVAPTAARHSILLARFGHIDRRVKRRWPRPKCLTSRLAIVAL